MKTTGPIKLPPTEVSLVAWALDPMRDYFCTEDGAFGRDGDIFPESCLPVLDEQAGTVDFSQIPKELFEDVVGDLKYRICEQYRSICDGAGGIYADGRGDDERMLAMRELSAVARFEKRMGWDNEDDWE